VRRDENPAPLLQTEMISHTQPGAISHQAAMSEMSTSAPGWNSGLAVDDLRHEVIGNLQRSS